MIKINNFNNFKLSIILIISLFFIFYIPLPLYAGYIDDITYYNCHYRIKVIKDSLDQSLFWGAIYAYMDGEECGNAYVGFYNSGEYGNYYDLEVNYSSEDLDKHLTFKYIFNDTIIDAISNSEVILDGKSHNSDEPYIELSIPDLPSCPIAFYPYVNYQGEITTKDSIIMNIEDSVKIEKIEAKYSDDSLRDVTDICNIGGSNEFFNEVQLNEFKAIKTGNTSIGFGYMGYRDFKSSIGIKIIDTSPSLLNSSITDNATNIPINNEFTFQFDKLISQGNNFSDISIINSQGNPCAVTKTIVGDTLMIKPIINLNYNENYILYIPANSIKNMGTQSNTEDLMYHFTTIQNIENPLVTGIAVGDTAIANFNPNVTTYNVTLPEGTTIAPTITVTSGDKTAVINVPPITVIPGSISITVSSADGSVVQNYVLNLTLGENDNCFIATAAYGSLLEPHVKVLRHFRDNVLMKFSFGQWFVKEYYRYSPPIAGTIRESEGLKFIVRMVLTPIIFCIEYWESMIIGLIILGMLIWKRKFRVKYI
ncbi:MAG: Ig-like domain-containing protein [Clostridium sp.]|uniref:CFI-box-CTERM domain-containing protein n=1 Tax=Clostridium sp. TaxID=1506 RepID=UPI0025C3B929|nr:CFI-box-CTERM domain-containing protein [Clostridium sp.]MCE5220057.1 Ig-like domain-containing protein [Clostridium sp.]